MAEPLRGKEEIMLSVTIPNDNTLKAQQGIEEEMAKGPSIEIVDPQTIKIR